MRDEDEVGAPAPRRRTRQRTAIASALRASRRFVSAQQLHATMRDAGESVGLATVYRTLQTMSAEDEADTVVNRDGETLYRMCLAPSHHHHLVCTSCGTTVELDDDAAEAWVQQMARAHGFSRVSHVLELAGTCRDCAAAEAAGHN